MAPAPYFLRSVRTKERPSCPTSTFTALQPQPSVTSAEDQAGRKRGSPTSSSTGPKMTSSGWPRRSTHVIGEFIRRDLDGGEPEARADAALHEGFGHQPGQRVGRLPTRAVAGHDPVQTQLDELLHGAGDDRLHLCPAEMASADEGVNMVHAGDLPSVEEHVDHAGVAAGGKHDQAPITDVNDHALIVGDQEVGLPAVRAAPVLNREPRLEVGHPLDLARDQHVVVEQQRRAPFLDQLDALPAEVHPVGCRSGGRPRRPTRETIPTRPPWWSAWPCESTIARRWFTGCWSTSKLWMAVFFVNPAS